MMKKLKKFKLKRTPIQHLHVTIGRNDICPCESGKKYKQCCLGKAKFYKSQEDADKATKRN
jgi:uncharacterized protein YchJ